MPKNYEAPKFTSPYVNRLSEEPLTRFLPLDQSVKVDVLEVIVPSYLEEFVLACHRSSPKPNKNYDSSRILAEIGRGRTLWQALEVVRFGIRMSQVSRIFTHQLVRARVGITFSQQCTGDVDSRHADVVVPNAYYKSKDLMYDFFAQSIAAKELYCRMVDEEGLSIQEARYCLPAGLTSFIYADVCLGTLAGLYSKRIDEMTQTWEMVVWAQALRDAVLEAAPWAEPLFTFDPRKSWFERTKSVPFANTHLWAPGGAYDYYDWNPESYVHGELTHREVSSGPPQEVSHFVGNTPVDKAVWKEKADLYKL